MPYKSLNHFVQKLGDAGALTRITEFVSPHLEITEIADRMVKAGGNALLFENNGTAFPVLINMMASDQRICLALGVKNLGEIGEKMEQLFRELMGPKNTLLDKLRVLPALQEIASWMPRQVSGRGACQEVVMPEPDLGKLPVLTCWPADGGPFITLPGVHTRCPKTGSRNLGMYRMQVFGPDLTGMHWHMHKGSANHYLSYKEMGMRMPVSVTLGGDPAYIYSATAPLPQNIDEYMLAGFLRGKKVELVRCLTNDLEVPSDVDFVIEGYVDPQEELILEGPFGDHTGFYSLAGYFPRFHVTCITHRRNAIYPATIVGVPPQEDGWIGKATERIFLMPVRMTVAPELTDMHMPVEGVFHNITLAGINKTYPGQAPKIMSALWGAGQMMFNKIMAVTGPDVDLHDYLSVARTISDRVDPVSDVHFLRGPVDILDHSSQEYAYGSKIGLDATPEMEGEYQQTSSSFGIASISEAIQGSSFPEITAVRKDLPSLGISCFIIAIRKSRFHHTRYLADALIRTNSISNVKFVVFVDEQMEMNDLGRVTWIVANNIDPVRDCFYIETAPGVKYPLLWIDGTRKTPEFDHFRRDWPNVIVMDEKTIEAVDQKWAALGLGAMVPSPSISLKRMVTSPGATAG